MIVDWTRQSRGSSDKQPLAMGDDFNVCGTNSVDSPGCRVSGTSPGSAL